MWDVVFGADSPIVRYAQSWFSNFETCLLRSANPPLFMVCAWGLYPDSNVWGWFWDRSVCGWSPRYEMFSGPTLGLRGIFRANLQIAMYRYANCTTSFGLTPSSWGVFRNGVQSTRCTWGWFLNRSEYGPSCTTKMALQCSISLKPRFMGSPAIGIKGTGISSLNSISTSISQSINQSTNTFSKHFIFVFISQCLLSSAPLLWTLSWPAP